MALLEDLPLDKQSPSRLWSRLEADTRRLAAKSLYDPRCEDEAGRAEADRALASALRYRMTSVRRLPLEKRADYLARAARPDDSLATSLLLALHFLHRRPMLAAFLVEMGIPHEDGVIEPGHEVDTSDGERLVAAVTKLRASYPADEVEVYLSSLVALDPDTWGALVGPLSERAD